MTKTHAELLGCPHCGEKPTHETYPPYSTPDGFFEGEEDIYCNSKKCQELLEEGKIFHWNTRVNKEAEFLEELKKYVNSQAEFYAGKCIVGDYNHGKYLTYLKIANKIEQFQAEQKVDK